MITGVSYGPTVLERLMFPVSRRHAGGDLSSWWCDTVEQDQCSYVAPGLVTAGINVLVLDLSSAGSVTGRDRSPEPSCAWAWHNADTYGWDRNQIQYRTFFGRAHLRHDAGHRLGGLRLAGDMSKAPP